jgi:hypothetical protein
VISLDLFGNRADVAKLHTELVLRRTGPGVMGTARVIAERLKLREDFSNGHAEDYLQ